MAMLSPDGYALPECSVSSVAATESPSAEKLVTLIPVLEIRAVFQAREFVENRYYRSKERGYDVGDTFTLEHWIQSHHAERFSDAFDANLPQILTSCTQRCGSTCKVYDLRRLLKRKNGMHEDDLKVCEEVLPKEEMHYLMHDS